MMEETFGFSLIGLKIYPFGCCLSIASILCTLVLLATHTKVSRNIRLNFAALSLVFTLVFARLGYFAVRFDSIMLDFGPKFLLRLDWGGFSLAGGILGIFFAAFIIAKRSNLKTFDILNPATPALFLFLACERFAEVFTTEGIGDYVENTFFQHFPFAILDSYEEFRVAVFFWEGLTAILIAILLWHRLQNKGNVLLPGMILFGSTQLFWESLRLDNFLRFGFVRVNQLLAIILVLLAVVVLLKQSKLIKKKILLTSIAYIIATLLLIAIEFGLDKSQISNLILYSVMILDLILMILGGYLLLKHTEKNNNHQIV